MKELKGFREYTDAEFEAKLIEVATKKARKEIKKIQKQIDLVGWKTEEGKELMKKECQIYADFKEKYGEKNLIILRIGKANQFGKSLNSKGNGYGNL
jgi:hypothetical protein